MSKLFSFCDYNKLLLPKKKQSKVRIYNKSTNMFPMVWKVNIFLVITFKTIQANPKQWIISAAMSVRQLPIKHVFNQGNLNIPNFFQAKTYHFRSLATKKISGYSHICEARNLLYFVAGQQVNGRFSLMCCNI